LRPVARVPPRPLNGLTLVALGDSMTLHHLRWLRSHLASLARARRVPRMRRKPGELWGRSRPVLRPAWDGDADVSDHRAVSPHHAHGRLPRGLGSSSRTRTLTVSRGPVRKPSTPTAARSASGCSGPGGPASGRRATHPPMQWTEPAG